MATVQVPAGPRESPRAGPAFALLESKLRPPPDRGASVPRGPLIGFVEEEFGRLPLVVLSAGPGWGKTTLLAQWAGRSDRAFAWVSADKNDNDPIVLLSYVAAALDRVSPLEPAVFEAFAPPGASVEAAVIPRLGAALANMEAPVVLAVDDLHLVQSGPSLDAIAALARHVPEGSQLVLSARGLPALPLAAWRARGHALEIGPDELRMNAQEARCLLRAAGVELPAPEIAELTERTEGWPAGLYLAALSARTRGTRPRIGAGFAGSDRLAADYIRSELLVPMGEEQIRFLTRTSVLKRMSGPLCDAVLESTGSAAKLEALEHSNLCVVALDTERRWYRYHHLVHELLRSDLERAEPQLAHELLRRAAEWSVANSQPEAAVAYAQEAGDIEPVASLVEQCALPTYQSGRAATVLEWLDWIEEHDTRGQNAAVAVVGALVGAAQGHPTASDRWADAAEHGHRVGMLADGSSSIDSWRALLRAVRCRGGVARMHADAALAARALARGSQLRPIALLTLAVSHWLAGESVEADDLLADAAEEGLELGAPEPAAVALGERAAIAIERGLWVEAEAFAERAVRIVRGSGMDDYPSSAFICAIAARIALHLGQPAKAEGLLASAQRLRPQLTYALPYLSIQTRLELARAYLTLADSGGAWTMVREIDSLLRRQPDAGALIPQVEELRLHLGELRAQAPGASTLTAAELRMLPLLTTHLSFREIGERSHLSRHTVKSHAVAIYRKLNVTCRDEAVQRARVIGIL